MKPLVERLREVGTALADSAAAEISILTATLLDAGWEHNPGADSPWKPPVNQRVIELRDQNRHLEAIIDQYRGDSKGDNFPSGYHQIREALVREIREARRWSAIEEAWSALGHVRLMGAQMKAEQDHLSPNAGTRSMGPAPDG